MFGIGVDVAAKLAGQIGHGGKYAAGDDVALEFGEPEFDLVEPGRIGGREVERDIGMPLEKLRYALGLVSGEVVKDDVDLGMAERNRSTCQVIGFMKPAVRNQPGRGSSG